MYPQTSAYVELQIERVYAPGGCIQKPIQEAELLKLVDKFIEYDDHHATCFDSSPRAAAADGRGLHSFPFLLNMSSSVHRITQLTS
jgi:hypothetical protein